MTSHPDDIGPAGRPRRRFLVLAGVLLLATVVAAAVLSRSGDDQPAADLTVGWGGSEGHPSCVYDPDHQTVDATIAIDGDADRHDKVTVTIGAYADENTSQAVGSGSRSVRLKGTVHKRLHVTFPVNGRPHVDIDGETACRLSVKY